jgi:uncharacterized protein (DUF1778 family)
MTISLRLNENECQTIKAHASLHGLSVSEFIRRAAIERIEDEYDLKIYEEALKEYKENPVTYSLSEAKRELGIQ